MSTFTTHCMAAITASLLFGYDATSLAHLYLGSFSHSSLHILSSSMRLDGERRCTAIFRSFQRYSIRFKSIQRIVSKPLLHCLGCVLRVIVLLEGEPSPQFEVLSTLEQVLIKGLFPSIVPSLPVPAAEKHPHSMMLPPPCFTVGTVPGFLQT